VTRISWYAITHHARLEMARRGISELTVRRILDAPQQRFEVLTGRDVLQSRVILGGREYLIRIFVDVDRVPPEVVTAYRTSKISKYWRVDP
jgi:hypothetical protein